MLGAIMYVLLWIPVQLCQSIFWRWQVEGWNTCRPQARAWCWWSIISANVKIPVTTSCQAAAAVIGSRLTL